MCNCSPQEQGTPRGPQFQRMTQMTKWLHCILFIFWRLWVCKCVFSSTTQFWLALPQLGSTLGDLGGVNHLLVPRVTLVFFFWGVYFCLPLVYSPAFFFLKLSQLSALPVVLDTGCVFAVHGFFYVIPCTYLLYHSHGIFWGGLPMFNLPSNLQFT